VIRFSGRYAKALIGVLLIFAVPILHTMFDARRRDDCRDPALLFVTSLIEGSKPTGESMPTSSDGVIQWSYGQLANPQYPKNPLRFQIVRSFDRAFSSPTNVLGETLDPEAHDVDRVPAPSGELPVHVAIDNTRNPSRFAAWVFLHDGRPTQNPFLSVLASAPRQLLGGSLPVTLLMVDGILIGEDPGPVTGVAKRWFVAAWEQFVKACR